MADQIKEGDKVSWNWGGGQPSGKVEAVVEGDHSIESKNGNEIKKTGSTEDPAVEISQGKNPIVKQAHELNEVDTSKSSWLKGKKDDKEDKEEEEPAEEEPEAEEEEEEEAPKKSSSTRGGRKRKATYREESDDEDDFEVRWLHRCPLTIAGARGL